jgi:hypothetical protein
VNIRLHIKIACHAREKKTFKDYEPGFARVDIKRLYENYPFELSVDYLRGGVTNEVCHSVSNCV